MTTEKAEQILLHEWRCRVLVPCKMQLLLLSQSLSPLSSMKPIVINTIYS